MPDIKVNTQSVQDAGSRFSQHAVALADMLSQVTKDMNDLESTWSGPAHSQFVTLMADWNKNMNGMHDDLNQVSDHLNKAGMGYSDLEQQITKGFTA